MDYSFKELIMLTKEEVNKIVAQNCDRYGIEYALMFSIIKAISHWNFFCILYDQSCTGYCKVSDSSETEVLLQRVRWGVTQIYGYKARQLGYEGNLAELIKPEINIKYAVKQIAGYINKGYDFKKICEAYFGNLYSEIFYKKTYRYFNEYKVNFEESEC